MKCLAFLIFLCSPLLISCKISATNLAANITEQTIETKVQVLPTPKSKEIFDIHSKIGIAEIQSDEPSCLRTKNGDLAENTTVSIIYSLDEPPQKVLTATIKKKLEKSCARRDSEIGDNNPGENFFYSLRLNEVKSEEIGYDAGIAVIQSEKPIQVVNNLASVDLNNDGKAEFFRRCMGFEGIHYTIWTGQPLKGKRIWHSCFYLDYDTEANCKKKDWEETKN